MKLLVCDDASHDTDPESPLGTGFARRSVSPRRARAERLITVLLIVLLAIGLLGLAGVAVHRHSVAAQARQQKLDAQRAAFDTEAEDAPTDDAPAVKRDAQGDQSSDE